MDVDVVIFGGTAAYMIDPADYVRVVEERVIETPYGSSPPFKRLVTQSGLPLWYASRHGENTLARSARFVNHRAHVWAARELGVELILSWNGVGAINPGLRVGDAVVPAAVMDWTRHRLGTFGPDAPRFATGQSLRAAARTIDHINHGRDPRQAARPFHEAARLAILKRLEIRDWRLTTQSPISHLPSPTYVCTEGPRLETPAEIELAAGLGADVVGMTLCPEVWLATELGLGYASLGIVTNFATGRWHSDPRRDFGPSVAGRALSMLLEAAELWQDDKVTG